MAVHKALRRVLLRVGDTLRTRNFTRFKARALLLRTARSRHPLARLKAFETYLVSHYDRSSRGRILPQALDLAARVGPSVLGPPLPGTPLRHSILLKAPQGPEEPGFLLVSFESELETLLRSLRLPEIEAHYRLLFVPTWQPFFSVPLFVLAAGAEKPFYILPSAFEDLPLCREIGPLCRGLPFHAASWVREDLYRPAPKDIDILMVANFSTYKRHWRLFEALRDLPRDLKVVLAGTPLRERTAEKLLEEAEAFGVKDRFELEVRPPDAVLEGFLAGARVFLGLSHKEGSYVAVAEALMADTPVGMYANARIGSKAYIREETGVLFHPDRPLAPQILAFLERAHRFTPRAWAIGNISAGVNCVRLNRILQEEALGEGRPWTRDLSPFFARHFDLFYTGGPEAEARHGADHRAFTDLFGIPIARPPAADYPGGAGTGRG